MGNQVKKSFGAVMSWRTVVIESQSKLDYKMGYMVIRSDITQKILLDEIYILIIANPAVAITGILLAALTEKKIKVIFCDTKRNPISELVPHHGSHDSASKIRTQMVWGDDIKSLVWQEIISEKIRKQAEFLYELDMDKQADMLSGYIGQIELADASNREGHAAKVYFNALFGMDFTRSADIPVNAALNYGYSLILSAFNREISANGYLTQLGIFHSNMFNHFNLSSDLMEPFRVLVDRSVYDMNPKEFDKKEKYTLLQMFDMKVVIDGQSQFLSNAIKLYTKSVFGAINDNDLANIKFYKMDK